MTVMEEATQKVVEEDIPKYLGFFEKFLEENNSTGYIVGCTISLADLLVFDMIDTYTALKKDCLKSYPLLQKLRKNVRAHPFLNAYLANRKQTDF
nr:hypothetical protein BaRGS_029382 [Batillaria attramentaria]